MTIIQAQALENRRNQLDAVYSALMKLNMLGLTLPAGMVECPPPSNIHPSRWKAMLMQAVNNPESL